jgi:hypothetical protein
MNDVQQILIWEKRRKALEWWNKLTDKQKAELHPDYTNIPEIEIEFWYENRIL